MRDFGQFEDLEHVFDGLATGMCDIRLVLDDLACFQTGAIDIVGVDFGMSWKVRSGRFCANLAFRKYSSPLLGLLSGIEIKKLTLFFGFDLYIEILVEWEDLA